MGVATGIAFDREENLYVGDRSGTIFKISPNRQIFVFATLEPSIAAYHLAFGADGYLYVTGPTTSSFDCVHRISHEGEVEVFYRGLGRPQGMAFDEEGRLYVAASISGRRGRGAHHPGQDARICSSPDRALWAWPSRLARHGGGDHQRDLPRGRRHQGPGTLVPMNAEIIAVGSEMLTPQRVDTNSLYLTGGIEQPGRGSGDEVRDRRRSRTPGGCRAARAFALGDRDSVRRPGSHRRRRYARSRGGGAGPQAGIPRRDRRQRWSSASRSTSARWRRSTSARRSSSKARTSCPTTAARRRASGWKNPARWRCCCPVRRTN